MDLKIYASDEIDLFDSGVSRKWKSDFQIISSKLEDPVSVFLRENVQPSESRRYHRLEYVLKNSDSEFTPE